MSDKRQAAIEIVSEMLSPEIAQAMSHAETLSQFGAMIGAWRFHHDETGRGGNEEKKNQKTFTSSARVAG